MAQTFVGQSRIVFMGSGHFAIPALQALLAEYPVVGVVTQPDREAGRGRKVQRGLVAGIADTHGLPVLQPDTFKSGDAVEALGRLEPDVIVVVSYGRILPRVVLDLPARGALNLHPSLLPRHRGPAPIAWTILSGDTKTGVTVIEMVAKMDAGPIVSQHELPVKDSDTTETLTARLAAENAQLLIETLPGWLAKSVTPIPQDEALATYTPMMSKEMGIVDWNKPAAVLEREVRAFIPWPVSRATVGESLRVLGVRVCEAGGPVTSSPGDVISVGSEGIGVQTGDGVLLLTRVQPDGGKPMLASDYARGRPELRSLQVGGLA
jgi:methionyl-tRNA formyltransferase